MDNLTQLRRRKAELKVQIEMQRIELKETFLEAREEIEPAALLKRAVSGIFKNKKEDGEEGPFKRLPAPVAFLADVFVKDPKWAFLVKTVAPLALKYIPKLVAKDDDAEAEIKEKEAPEPKAAEPEKPKTSMLSKMRRGVSKLRTRIKKQDETPQQPFPDTDPDLMPEFTEI